MILAIENEKFGLRNQAELDRWVVVSEGEMEVFGGMNS